MTMTVIGSSVSFFGLLENVGDTSGNRNAEGGNRGGEKITLVCSSSSACEVKCDKFKVFIYIFFNLEFFSPRKSILVCLCLSVIDGQIINRLFDM